MAKQSKGEVTSKKPVFEEDESVKKATKEIIEQVKANRIPTEKLGADYAGYLEKVLHFWITQYYTIVFPLISNGTLKFVYKDGHSAIEYMEKETIRIAKHKYNQKHFKEIERLIKKGYKTEKAYQDTADKYGFESWEGLGKMYQKRYLDKKITPKKK